ncbi:MAG: hypothetical protein AAF688_10515 [Bacteroidota bacterium]
MIILLLIAVNLGFSQLPIPTGYSIDGDDVVFRFNREDYDKYSDDTAWSITKFDNLDIKTVSVAGEFNNWSKTKWKMTKIDKNTYELRKPLSKFEDEYSWAFKFVINDRYWAEPENNAPNLTPALKYGILPLHVNNLNMYTKAHPAKDGNVRFRLRGFEDAEHVIVAGSFNKWNEKMFKMYKIDSGWELKLQMLPGDYEYRYIVDGNWMEDPTNPDRVPNEFGEYNSHINIGKFVTFRLNGYENAQNVILSGSFNDWNEEELEMEKSVNGYWTCRLPLSAGKHHYKFIVDGNWMLDPENPVKESDGMGHVNSVWMVR